MWTSLSCFFCCGVRVDCASAAAAKARVIVQIVAVQSVFVFIIFLGARRAMLITADSMLALKRRNGAMHAAWRRPLVGVRWLRLEDDLRSQLQLTSREGARNVAEGSVAHVAIGRLVVDFVEDVERFRAEVEAGTFAPQRERLVQTEVGLVEGRSDNHVALRIAERAAGGWDRDARACRGDHTGNRRCGGLDQVPGEGGCCLRAVGGRGNSGTGNVGT